MSHYHCVVWIDHREALIASGSNRGEFFSEARQECIRFLHQLNVNANQQIGVRIAAV